MANNLKKYRGKHCLSQSELADKLGITKARLNYLELNKLTYDIALKCSEILSENVFALLGEDALIAMPSSDEDVEALRKIISPEAKETKRDVKFGDYIKSLRINKNLKVKELAEITGITQASIILFEKGKRIPSETIIGKLAVALDADYDELYNLAFVD